MSHYVIRLTESWSNYLAELPDYRNPQWQLRAVAKRFATAVEARAYLKALDDRGLDYPGNVVYLRTADDLKAERKALRSSLSDIAEGDCHYEDGCPVFGSRHGTCTRCVARRGLARARQAPGPAPGNASKGGKLAPAKVKS